MTSERPDAPEALARSIIREHENGLPFMHNAAERCFANLASAYAAQAHVAAFLGKTKSASPCGYKIGLTSPRMQAMCGLDQPVYGQLLPDRITDTGAAIPLESALGLESEFAVRMGRDLSEGADELDLNAVASAVDSICPAFEIINHRRADFSRLNAAELIADNVWNRGAVLGEFQAPTRDFADRTCTLLCDGEIVSQGAGVEVLGHPYNALLWLAQTLQSQDQILRAGAIVLTGSLFAIAFPQKPARYRFETPGLGAAELNVV